MRFFILTGIVLGLVACSVAPRKNDNYDAKKELEKLDAPNVPSIEQSLEKSAIDALKSGDNARAMSLYQQLFDKNSQEDRYILGLAESTRRVGDNENAVTYYDLIIDKHPGHLDAIEGKALAKLSAGQLDEATRLFGLLMTRDAKRWRTLNALGVMFAMKNLPNDALVYFQEADKYSPGNPSVLNNMGLSQAIARDYKGAVRTLRMASTKSEGQQRKHVEMNLALVYGIAGNMQLARKVAERHLQGAALDNNLGLYAYLSDNGEMAKSYLNMALTGSPKYYERAWENLDIISTDRQGNHGGAESSAKSVTVSSPSSAVAVEDLGEPDLPDLSQPAPPAMPVAPMPPASSTYSLPPAVTPYKPAPPAPPVTRTFIPQGGQSQPMQSAQPAAVPPVVVQPQAVQPLPDDPALPPYTPPSLQPDQRLRLPVPGQQ